MAWAYYNEIDPYAAEWLRRLSLSGYIAPGYIDERSILNVRPNDLRGFTQCHFFAGIGVWSYALRYAGWPDDRPVWTGSCPCQPFSAAGKGAGFADERHLWPAFYHLIRECRPDAILGEQVSSQDGLAWFDSLQGDLEDAGYACGALDTCAAGVGSPHVRQRLYWLAHALDGRRSRVGWGRENGTAEHGEARGLVNADGAGRFPGQRHDPAAGHGLSAAAAGGGGLPGPTNGFWRDPDWLLCRDGKWRPVRSGSFPLAHGASSRVGRLRAYGNAIVAPQAAEFIRVAREVLDECR